MRRVLRALLLAIGVRKGAPASADGPGVPSYTDAFTRAFAPEFSVETRDEFDNKPRIETVPFKVIDAGQLIIVSGRVAAADPLVTLSEREAFTQPVPNGKFPVRLAVGGFPSGGVRVAFARIDFKIAPIVTWKMALIDGQDPAELKDTHVFGYGVDAGTGCFFDPAAGTAAGNLLKEANLSKEGSAEEIVEKWIADGSSLGEKVIGPYSFLLDVPLGPANVIMFHSGWGDGYYASYFGFDAKGDVVALVTDFETIDWAGAKW